ncbi:MAG: response regulator, partial [Planctomycetota bacterium]
RAGIRYFATTDVEEAKDRLRMASFTVMLTDLVLDTTDGIELFLWARRRHPLLRGICASAFLDQDKLQRVIAAGFDDCLIKPVHSDRLIPSIRSSLALYQRWQGLLGRLQPA